MRNGRLIAAAVLWAGCREPRPRPAQPQPRPRDKAALFADASLVPTREGERSRREVALAGELQNALALLHGVDRSRVHVRLDEGGTVRDATVVIRAAATATLGPLRDSARAISLRTLSLADPDAPLTLQVSQGRPAQPAPPDLTRLQSVALGLALLGLGFSLGVGFDRLRTRLRRGAL